MKESLNTDKKSVPNFHNKFHDKCFIKGCENTMPDLSDLVPFHSGQVGKFLSTCSGTSI